MAASITTLADIRPALKPSTARMQIHRKRKAIRQIATESDWTVAALQNFYLDYDLPITTWIQASEFFDAEITSENLPVKLFYSSNWDEFVMHLNDPGIEITMLKSGINNSLLIRPRFLKDDLNQ
jgi:hypothetical protein